MSVKTISSRAFNQDTNGAKKAATAGPVIITDRGRPSYVLLTYDTYRSLTARGLTIGEALYMPGVADVEFELPSRKDVVARDVDLT